MKGPESIRVMVVDDHALVRRGLAAVLAAEPGFDVVGEAGDGAAAIECASTLRPDVILMDVRMPGVSGLEATRQILAALPQTKIVMLTMTEDEEAVFEAVKGGAQGYLLKTVEPDELFVAVRGVMQGEAALSNTLATKLVHEFARRAQEPATPAPSRKALSPPEKTILALVADGKSNKEIAAILGLAENTVKNHVKNILEKLHLENRVQAAVYALSPDFIVPSASTTSGARQN